MVWQVSAMVLITCANSGVRFPICCSKNWDRLRYDIRGRTPLKLEYVTKSTLRYILVENETKEQLNSTICCDFTLASLVESAMLMEGISGKNRSTTMTTQKFDATPTPSEGINLDDISDDSVKKAWKDYEAKAEYKKFNKHDMIESMQHAEESDENPKPVQV